MNQKYICCYGETLWDLFPSGKLPGGAPMNVATHLQNLGTKSYMISAVGDDELGEGIKDFLKSKSCSTDYIQTHPFEQTGIVKVTLSEKLDATYEIVQPVAWDYISLNEELISLVKDAEILVFGSLVCRNQTSFDTLNSLLDVAKIKVFDINVRPPFYSQELVEKLLSKVDIIKLNDQELEILKEWYGLSSSDSKQILSEILKKFNLKMVIVTLGGEGAMILDGDDFYRVYGKKVKVADTIGCGDSFLAGFLKNYLEGKPTEYSLKYAAALGALVATHHGANPSITEQQIFEMMD